MSEHILEKPKGNFLYKLVESKIFWTLAVATLFTLPLIRSFQKAPVEELPVYGKLNDFNLVNQEGRQITSQEFSGSVLLVNFIFTRCPDVCPFTTQKMAKFQERLKGTAKNVQLVSISVDPAYDSPEVLKKYAEKYHADTKIWSFLTGDLEEVRKLVVDNFKSAMDGQKADPKDYSGLMELSHGEHFVLVDQIGQIRGYRIIKTDEDINKIVREFAILVNTFPPQEKTQTTPEDS